MATSLTREQKIAKARKLQAQGLSLREIARRMGYKSRSPVHRLLNPEVVREQTRRANIKRAPAKRAWERQQDRPACPSCGGPRGIGSRRKSPGLCRKCRIEKESERVLQRAGWIVVWWAQGLTVAEIAREIGWSPGHTAQEIHRLRGEGFDLPYRQPPKQVEAR